MERDQLAYIPELFDIHVMVFADDSDAAVGALQEIFRIERDEAQRLIADAPVVVKRAATPEIAEALLDALSLIGAQVVLMPARGREPARVVAPAPAAAHVPTAATAPALSTSAGWGGLDLAEQTRARRPAPETWDQSGSIPAALAGGDDLDYAEPPRVEPPRAAAPRVSAPRVDPPRVDPPRAESPLLELDVPSRRSNDRVRTVLASAERTRARAPAAEVSLPPSRRESLPPGLPSLTPSPRVDGFDHAPLSSPLAPASLRPQVPSLAPPPPPPARAIPPPAPPAAPQRKAVAGPPPPPPPPQVAASPARKPGVPPPPPPPDLGLGTVPPLPLLAGAASSEAPAPPRKARSSPRPPPHDPPRFEHRIVDAGEAMKLPRIDVSTPLLRPSPSAEAAATAHAGRPSATTAVPDANGKPARAGSREPSTRFATQGAHGSQAAQDSAAQPASEQVAAKPKVAPARGRALAEIAFGLLVFYVGLNMDNTVLHGNASLTWILLHALGVYAIGSGLRGLWP